MYPESLGRYRLLERLARGGQGEVWLADSVLEPGRRVAVKTLLTEDDRARLLAEARIGASLRSHPNVVRTLDVGLEDERLFLVMELLEGRTLAQLERGTRLPCEAAVGIAVQVLAALEHLQDARLVHRDLKPSNLFVTREGVVKLIDFGLAHAGGATAETTATGTIRGTVSYLSPEQARNERPDHKSDVFSLGVVLHELLTGRRLFSQETVAAQLSAILFGSVPPVASVRSDVPAALDAAVGRALARDAAARPGPRELQRLLRAAIAPAEPWSPTDLAAWLATQRLPRFGELATTSLPGPISGGTRTEAVSAIHGGVTRLQRRLLAAVMTVVAGLAVAVAVRVVMRSAAVEAPLADGPAAVQEAAGGDTAEPPHEASAPAPEADGAPSVTPEPDAPASTAALDAPSATDAPDAASPPTPAAPDAPSAAASPPTSAAPDAPPAAADAPGPAAADVSDKRAGARTKHGGAPGSDEPDRKKRTRRGPSRAKVPDEP